MKINKTNHLLIAVISLGIIALVVTGFGIWKLILAPQPQTALDEEEEVILPEIDSSVKVAVTAQSDNREVTLSISAIPKGTESIEYELSYDTSAGLPKGALGTIKLSGESSIERKITLGTCSRNVCKYDEGVTKINLVLRFNTADGASQFQKSYDL